MVFPRHHFWYSCLSCHRIGFNQSSAKIRGLQRRLHRLHRLQSILAAAWLQYRNEVPAGLLHHLGLTPQHPLLGRLEGRLGFCVWPDFRKYLSDLVAEKPPRQTALCLTLPIERMPGYLVGWLFVSRQQSWLARPKACRNLPDQQVYLTADSRQPIVCPSVRDALAEWLALQYASVTIVAPPQLMPVSSLPAPHPAAPPPQSPDSPPVAAERSSADLPAPPG